MVNARRVANATLLVSFLGTTVATSAESPAGPVHTPPAFDDSGVVSTLEGLVRDERGQPLVGAMVSVFGKNLTDGARIAITDDEGRFRLPGVRPGLYRLRAYLAGFLPSSYARVVIPEGAEEASAILMSMASLAESAASASGELQEQRTASELGWLLQRGERNILKDDQQFLPGLAFEESPDATWFEPNFAMSGEVGVMASAFEDPVGEFPGTGAGLDARKAYARLTIPTAQQGYWLVSAQVVESALSSWAGRAEWVGQNVAGHRLAGAVSYGNYLYGDLDPYKPPTGGFSHRVSGDRSTEWFGGANVDDSFVIGAAEVRVGLEYQYLAYLDKAGYLSPRLDVAYGFGDDRRTIMRGVLDQRVLAPGGDDIHLLSSMVYSDVYGTPSQRHGLKAQRTARYQVGVEHQLGRSARVAVRVFQETATDQLVKTYLKDNPGIARGGAGHFLIENQGDFRTRGLGLVVSQRFGAMEGSVGYTFGFGRALRSIPGSAETMFVRDEEIHDLTTTLATEFAPTRTRLQAAYRLISHPTFIRPQRVREEADSLDSRFNIQVYQLLPFVDWNGTKWELMVAIRNLFYEDLEETSFLDEISVLDAPRRVLGGVSVRF